MVASAPGVGARVRERSQDSDLLVLEDGRFVVGGLLLGFGKSEYPPGG